MTSSPVRAYLRDTHRNLAYVLLSWPIWLLGLVVVLPLLAVGVATVVVWIGLPVLALTVLVARAFADVERGLHRSLLHRDLPRPVYARSPLRDTQGWLDVLWTLLAFVVSTVTFVVALVWCTGAAATVLAPLSVYVLDRSLPAGEYTPLLELLGLSTSRGVEAAAEAAVGLVFLLTLPAAARGLAAVQASMAHAVLGERAERQVEVAGLRTARAAGRQAEGEQLRRLERGIHDGPQQRLVRLKMDLARARRLADTSPDDARRLIDGALEQTQGTLDELRQLSRGLAPPVLLDRGLAAAVQELAGRSMVPVEVDVEVPRLAEHVETAAYYVVSEALANVNKHADATAARVRGRLEGTALVVSVTDDGRGGAELSKGHGLAGLEARLAAVDGRLTVGSPPGGPTRVEAVIACES